MAILEGAVQTVEEDIPVLVAVQELSAPTAFKPFYDAEQVFSSALLLTPPDYRSSPLATVRLTASREVCDFPALPATCGVDWSDNFAAKLLPLLAALATPGEEQLHLPLSAHSSMSLNVTVHGSAEQVRA